jgi:hypothetical protein
MACKKVAPAGFAAVVFDRRHTQHQRDNTRSETQTLNQ